LTSDRALMGADANKALTSALGWTVTVVIGSLNAALIYLMLR
jgi:manganese transport protein